MWEAIARNQLRSQIFIMLMGILLVLLGFALGTVIHPRAAIYGALIAAGLWLLLWLIAVAGGDAIVLAQAGAKKVSREDAPQLWNVVEEMKIASGILRMPDIYIIDDSSPNAFAIGRKPEKYCAVAVTSGLLRMLDRDELQGVVGHEIGHLKNRDTSFMIMAGVMLGAIVLIADILWRVMRVGGGRSRGKGGGQAQIAILILALVFAILAPILARMLYFACSRHREYLADASSARFTRYPVGLASALQKISGRFQHPVEASRVLAPMYIINPMTALAVSGLFATHPPTETRVKILRTMAGGADYGAYESAFKRVTGGHRNLMGAQTLADKSTIAIRPPSAEPVTKQRAAERSREALDMVGRIAGYLMMTCGCGVGIKVPPKHSRSSIACPRCGRLNHVEKAAPAASAPPLQYRRRGKGWETAACTCGHGVEISPGFAAPAIFCPKCERKIEIIPPA